VARGRSGALISGHVQLSCSERARWRNGSGLDPGLPDSDWSSARCGRTVRVHRGRQAVRRRSLGYQLVNVSSLVASGFDSGVDEEVDERSRPARMRNVSCPAWGGFFRTFLPRPAPVDADLSFSRHP